MVPALYRRNAFILILAACQAVQVARSVCAWSREGEKNHDRLSNCSCSGSKFGNVIINPTKCLLLAPRKMPVIKLLKLFTERLLELSFCPWLREQKQAMEKKKTKQPTKTNPKYVLHSVYVVVWCSMDVLGTLWSWIPRENAFADLATATNMLNWNLYQMESKILNRKGWG